MDYEKEIPFGAFDSELMEEEISIPDGFEAVIEGNKIILKKVECDDEKIRKAIIEGLKAMKSNFHTISSIKIDDAINWLEKQYIKKSSVSELRQKVQNALLKSAIDYYEAERACCEISAPQQWKDDRNKAYDEFIWRCQDYQIVNESDNIDLEDLNYNYL